jgi:hypothetical protein
MSTLRRGTPAVLVWVFLMCLTLATPRHMCAASSSSLTGTIAVVEKSGPGFSRLLNLQLSRRLPGLCSLP